MKWLYGATCSILLAALIVSLWPRDKQIPIEPDVTFGAGGDAIFNDTFTDANNTELSVHTPDAGTGWVKNYTAGTGILDIDSNVLGPGQQGTSDGAAYYANVTYPSDDYQIQYTCTDCGADDEYVYGVIRGNSSDINQAEGAYVFYNASAVDTEDPILARVSGAGICANVDTLDAGQIVTPLGPNSATILLQAVGSEISAHTSAGASTGVAGLFFGTTTTIPSGKGGIGMGALPCVPSGDQGVATEDDNQRIDDFKVFEIASAATSYSPPSTTGERKNDWSNPTNAYSDDGSYAEEDDVTGGQDFGDFGFSIPAGSTIRGFQMKIEGEAGAISNWVEIGVNVSNDNGATWSATTTARYWDSAPDTYILGHANYLWGLTWTVTDTDNDNLRIKLTHTAAESVTAGRDLEVDYVTGKIFYDPPAGAPPIAPPKPPDLPHLL
jgi:hypothetical protein